MTFLFPWALIGLAAAAIPILLHLVERRQPPERSFPAVRYLEDATRDQRRRLKCRHLLLLALRTLLVVLVVLAAAGARLHRAVPLGAHTPIAVVLIVDNSASSGAVMDGEPTIEALRTTARAVLERATPSDRLWLLLADGVARPGTATELLARLDAVEVIPDRLELGQAVRQADALIRNAGRRGEVVVVSDVQRSAVSPVEVEADVIVLRPAATPPRNRAIAELMAGDQPWSGQGGRIAVQVVADDTTAVAARLTAGASPPRDLLLTPGVPSTQRISLSAPGWHLIEVSLPADELRLDDTRQVAVQVAPPTGVNWSVGDRFLDAALRVLIGERRLLEGGESVSGDSARARRWWCRRRTPRSWGRSTARSPLVVPHGNTVTWSRPRHAVTAPRSSPSASRWSVRFGWCRPEEGGTRTPSSRWVASRGSSGRVTSC